MRTLALILFIVCLASVVSSAQTPVLSRELVVESAVDPSYGFAIDRVGTAGAVALSGTFLDSIVVEGARLTSRGLADGFLYCVSDEFRLQWLKVFGGAGYDAITCVAPLADGGLVVGMLCGAGVDGFTSYRVGDVTFTGRGGADAVVFVINADGTMRWVRNDGAFNAEYPTAIGVLGDSLIIVSGVFVRESRFGADIINDSAEISAYVQAIDLSGRHRWVRVIRGWGLFDTHSAVRLEPLHVNTTLSGRVDVVVASSEAVSWGDSVVTGQQAELYGTTAVVHTNASGDATGIDNVEACPGTQSVYGCYEGGVSAASAERPANSCTSLQFDVISFHASAIAFPASRIDVPQPGVERLRSSVRGNLISGSTKGLGLILALAPQGNERWRYVHGNSSATMYDAIETDSSVTAVVLSDKLSLLQFGLSTNVSDGTEGSSNAGDGIEGSSHAGNGFRNSKNRSGAESAKIIYYDEIGNLLQQGYFLTSLNGTTFSSSSGGAFASSRSSFSNSSSYTSSSSSSSPLGGRPLAPQLLVLSHVSFPTRLVLLMP